MAAAPTGEPGEDDGGVRPGWGRWPVRLVALLGVGLLTLSAVGWWLSTRVLDDRGFADVVTKASQREPVRDYVADQATLRLARSSNFVSAARPLVSDAVSQALQTQPVQEAIRDFAVRAHRQVFASASARRVNVSSAQAAVTVRSALETINPALARKVPNDVLSATTTISQSKAVDTLVGTSRWIEDLYIPFAAIGMALLVLAIAKARDRVHAIRACGVMLATAGALLFGIGGATPAFASAAATNDPGRGDAVAQFIDVLAGRVVGAGKGMIVIGLALALAPGHDGGDLRDRWRRVRAWFAEHRERRGWQFAGGLALAAVAGLLLGVPTVFLTAVLTVAAILVLYVGIVVCLRATGALVTDHTIKRLHARAVALVLAALVAGSFATGAAAVALVAANTETPQAKPTDQGCNGYIELCALAVNQIVWPASHNAMASSAYDFLGAEHTITVPEQLNAGARFLMLDAYYGYDDDGLVRTNLAGGVNRAQLEADRGEQAVHELDRIGALTGAADTSGKKQDVYFCHDLCELGAVKATEILGDIRDFLDQNLTDVVIIDIEDYVRPRDFKQALIAADLFDRVWIPEVPGTWPSLYDMVHPKRGKDQQPRRLIVEFEKHKSPYHWLLNTYKVSEETNFTYTSAAVFDCAPKRGGTGKSMLIVNHWIQPGGVPNPILAAKTNSQATIERRVQECVAVRQKVPNVIAVNFTASGDLFPTVRRLNSAIALQSGVTGRIEDLANDVKTVTPTTKAEAKQLASVKRSLRRVRRLPHISEKKARALLGPLADRLPEPAGVDSIVDPSVPRTTEAAPSTATIAPATLTPATTAPTPTATTR